MNEQKNEKPQKQDASISRQFKANLNVERKLSLRSAPNPSKLLPSLRVLNNKHSPDRNTHANTDGDLLHATKYTKDTEFYKLSFAFIFSKI